MTTKMLLSLIIATVQAQVIIWDEMYRVSTAQTNQKCRSIMHGLFLDLSTLFSRLDLKDANMKNLSIIIWVYDGINTCDMVESLAHQTKWKMGGTSQSAIFSDDV